jgi:hypothetical protein
MSLERIRLKVARMVCPASHAIVPRQPTPKMTQAAAKAMSPGRRPTQEWVSCRVKHTIRYQAMLEAAE